MGKRFCIGRSSVAALHFGVNSKGESQECDILRVHNANCAIQATVVKDTFVRGLL